jgi:flagellar biosynthetic protein FliP
MSITRRLVLTGLVALAAMLGLVAVAGPAAAQNVTPTSAAGVTPPAAGGVEGVAPPSSASDSSDPTISVDVGSLTGSNDEKPGQSVVIILLLTVLAVAPALLVCLTSFTRIVIVLSLTRNALGLTSIPPNQVVIGLSLFLSFFVMAPTFNQINKDALQPMLDGKISYSEAYSAASDPLRDFMLDQTRRSELNLFINASGGEKPESRDDIPMTTLVPAFVLSELKTAFIIGFVVFVPFLIIDLVISSALMSMGMFMLPPVLVSLPFKLLLFVMVDGWALVVQSLISSFNH